MAFKVDVTLRVTSGCVRCSEATRTWQIRFQSELIAEIHHSESDVYFVVPISGALAHWLARFLNHAEILSNLLQILRVSTPLVGCHLLCCLSEFSEPVCESDARWQSGEKSYETYLEGPINSATP